MILLVDVNLFKLPTAVAEAMWLLVESNADNWRVISLPASPSASYCDEVVAFVCPPADDVQIVSATNRACVRFGFNGCPLLSTFAITPTRNWRLLRHQVFSR